MLPNHLPTIRLTVYLAARVLCISLLLVLGFSSVAHGMSFYSYGENGSTCWQTGQPGTSSFACDSVGAEYIPGHEVEGGISAQIALTTSGDYCGFYRLGDTLTSEDSSDDSINTGYETPTPYGEYQEDDAYQNVCQAYSNHWGQEVQDLAPKNGCWETCGMNHYASFGGQETSDRPWSSAFSEPSLVVSADADPQGLKRTGTGTDVGAWGYLCPVLKDTATGNVLEYCLQEWRSKFNAAEWTQERVGTCASGDGTNIDTIQTYFWPGTAFATEGSGSANTFVFEGSGTRYYEASITRTNLETAIKADNEKCGRSSSTNPANYALIGVEQGLEGWRELAYLGGNTAGLELHTTYSSAPPEVATGSASEVGAEQALLTGTVNPDGAETSYYFQYGTSTNYGNSTGHVGAGSGTSGVNASATIGELAQETTYHYRLVATNEHGTEYGADHTVSMGPRMSVGLINTNGAVYSPNPLSVQWKVISPSDHPSVVSVSGTSVGYIDATGAYWSSEPATVPFTKLCGPESNPTAISVSGKMVGVINSSGAQYSPEPLTVGWKQVSSASNHPSAISVGGTAVGYIDSTGAYWSKEPPTVGFTELTGASGKPTAISVSGKMVGLINSSGGVYSPEPLTVGWKTFSAASNHPSTVSVNGTAVGYIDSTGAYWSKEPPTIAFTELYGASAKPTVLSVSGTSVGLITSGGAYFSREPLTVQWTWLSSSAATPTAISVG